MSKERIYYFDNVKAILIILVVFGHMLEPLLMNNPILIAIYNLIYCFHMPLFALISGFFSKKEHVGEFKDLFFKLLFFEVVFALTFLLVFIIGPGELTSDMQGVAATSGILAKVMMVLSPIWLLWYLLSLISWKFLLIFFKKSKKSIYIAIALAFIIPFMNFDPNFLSLKRTFALFPFFLFGYFLSTDQVMVWKRKISAHGQKMFYVKNIFYLSIILLIGLAMLYSQKDLERFIFFCNSFYLSQYGVVEFAILLILVYGLAITLCYVVLKLVPENKNYISQIGRNTFNIYIFHGLIYWLLLGFGFYSILLPLPDVVNLIIIIFITWAITWFFTLKPIDEQLNKINYTNFKRMFKWKK